MNTLKEAYGVVGKPTTDNSKMGDYVLCFNTDPHECNTGSALQKVEGSVCENCYSISLCNFRSNVHKSYKRNHDLLSTAMQERGAEGVAEIVSFIINKKGREWVRDRDGGDCVSPEEFDMWTAVAKRNPEVNIWKPTKEAKWLRNFLSKAPDVPDNVVFRVSSPMVDQEPLNFPHTSVVYTQEKFDAVEETETVRKCIAHEQDNQCLDCSMCWASGIKTIVYPFRQKKGGA